MIMKNLIIIGAGQYGQVTKEAAEAMGCYGKISFLDDNNPQAIGKISDYEKFIDEYECAVVAIGNSDVRLSLIEKLDSVGYEIVTIIHPKAYISPHATIGKGCIIEANVTVNTDAVLGTGVIVSANAVVNHNSVVEKGCHIDAGAVVPSNKTILAGTDVTLM